MRITVFGAGGVGGYFGGKLAVAGHDVRLIARGAHLKAVRANGLTVTSGLGDFHVEVPATDDPGEIGACDAVLFCVKSYDTVDAARRLAPLLRDGTAVVSLQNGVDNEAVIADVIGWHHVVGGASFIFAAIDSPGVIAHTGGPSSLAFGEFDGVRSPRVLALAEACTAAGIPTDVPDDIRAVLWSKYAFICAQAGMTATTRLPIGVIRGDESAFSMYRALVAEAVAVARAEGVRLPENLVDSHLRATAALEPEGRSSLYHDLVNGHRMELEALHGNLSRLAAGHGLPVPATLAVYAILSPWAARAGSA
jgi:2-dehydropantoate 2-reductase